MDFKYLKYKNKYLFLKNQFGSSSLIHNWVPLRIKLMSHPDIMRLGQKKIVATPESGDEVRQIFNMWQALDEDTQNNFKEKFKLGVFIYKDEAGIIPESFSGNLIIFYHVEYLNLLALASDKTIEELLNIFALPQNLGTFNRDLVKIAFGDIFGNGYDTRPLDTEEGQTVLDKYLSNFL